VWGVADSEAGAGVWEDVGWGGNETPLVAYAPSSPPPTTPPPLPLLHATAGTFWTDGTTMYVHPLGRHQPHDRRQDLRPVGNRVLRHDDRRGQHRLARVLLTGAGYRVRRLAVGGMAETVDAHNTYGILIIPTERWRGGTGRLPRLQLRMAPGRRRRIRRPGPAITRAATRISRLAYPQASDWATTVPFVFSARANVTGMTLDLDDLSQSQAYQLAGSTAGQTPAFAGAVYAHGAGHDGAARAVQAGPHPQRRLCGGIDVAAG
jgi:hypothetical protein